MIQMPWLGGMPGEFGLYEPQADADEMMGCMPMQFGWLPQMPQYPGMQQFPDGDRAPQRDRHHHHFPTHRGHDERRQLPGGSEHPRNHAPHHVIEPPVFNDLPPGWAHIM